MVKHCMGPPQVTATKFNAAQCFFAQPDDLCIVIWISVMIIYHTIQITETGKAMYLYASLKYNTPHNLVAENWDEALGSDGYHE